MILSLIFFMAMAGVLASALVPGWNDLLLIAGPSAIASLLLLLHSRGWPFRGASAAKNYVVVDGSNVMHWKDGTPDLRTVKEVSARLATLGFTPGIVFDANAGYKMAGRFQNTAELAGVLGLPQDRVMVVPKGDPADPYVLGSARQLGARVVSNDRFRDWAGEHPEIAEPGQVIRGGYRDGKLWLDAD